MLEIVAEARGHTAGDAGEHGLIGLIAERLGPPPRGEVWAGDDTAIVASPGTSLLLTTDLVVEGVDFDFAYCDGTDVGHKAMAASASDIAAMGGRPTHAMITLALATSTPIAVVEDLLDGLTEAAMSYGLALVGGDISEADSMAIGVAVIGAAPQRAILRSGARPGHLICVTGTLGGAAGGLEVLRKKMVLPSGQGRALMDRQRRPQPRLDAGALLAEAGACAMIDVSDGLLVDLGHILDASGTGCRLESASIPADPALAAIQGFDALHAALTGGEDFELLLTIEEKNFPAARAGAAKAGVPLSVIGRVTVQGRMLDERPLEEFEEDTWQHLRTR